jgi:DNA-binding MarR family transcriptional regulator
MQGGQVRRRVQAGGREPLTIKDLLSYKISRTANAMSRSAALRYQQFGVSLQEWRTIALLAAEAPMSLNELARAAGLDKAQMSRAVSALVERGFVLRKESEAGGRAVEISLSRRGEALYKELIAAARERDAAFQACLSETEHAVLEGALRRLQSVARALSEATGSSPRVRGKGRQAGKVS